MDFNYGWIDEILQECNENYNNLRTCQFHNEIPKYELNKVDLKKQKRLEQIAQIQIGKEIARKKQSHRK